MPPPNTAQAEVQPETGSAIAIGEPKKKRQRGQVLTEALPTRRSRVSNGKSLFLNGGNQNGREARRFRDVLTAIISDLGGADRLSEGQRQLARRCAMLAVECERLEEIGVAGGEINLETYGMLTDRMGRAFQRLGLKRVPKPVLSLAEHLAKLAETPPSIDDDNDDEVVEAQVETVDETPT